MILSIDFETRSAVDIKKAGAHRYAQDPTTDIWCACYAFDDGHGGYVVMPGGLARVAESHEHGPVHMQLGARSEDVWVLSHEHVAAFSMLAAPDRPLEASLTIPELAFRYAGRELVSLEPVRAELVSGGLDIRSVYLGLPGGEDEIFVGGRIASLGVDAVEAELTELDAAWLRRKLGIYDLAPAAGIERMTKIVAGKQLWNYDNLEPTEKKIVL